MTSLPNTTRMGPRELIPRAISTCTSYFASRRPPRSATLEGSVLDVVLFGRSEQEEDGREGECEADPDHQAQNDKADAACSST